ncbi:hypothetical protein ACLQ23_29555 [Micromonospora sp. DT41]
MNRAPAGDFQQLLIFLVAEPPHAYWICHRHSPATLTPAGRQATT